MLRCEEIRGRFVEGEGSAHDIRATRVQDAEVDGREQPLVRIHDDRIGAGGAVEDVAMLFEQRRGSSISGIDVQPEAMAFGDCGDGGQRIDCGRGCGSQGRDHAERFVALREIALDHRLKRGGLHAKFRVGGDLADIFNADADGERSFIDGVVGVLRTVENEARVLAGEAGFGRGEFARGEDRMHARRRRGVVDDAEEIVGESPPLAQPAERHLFELGGRG